MCDCYEHKCENCDRLVAIHIGDFCITRKSVRVLCDKCYWKVYFDFGGRLCGNLLKKRMEKKMMAKYIKFDSITANNQVTDKYGTACGKVGDCCIIMWNDDDGHDIYLN